MRAEAAAWIVLCVCAFAGPAGRSLTFDMQAETPSAFSNVVTAGEAFDWQVNLTTNGVLCADTLYGWMGYATGRTASAWVRFSSVTSTAGVCYFRMTAADSSGLSTNPSAYPIAYPASIVLTNSTGTRAYRLRAGALTIKRDSAVSTNVGAAVAE